MAADDGLLVRCLEGRECSPAHLVSQVNRAYTSQAFHTRERPRFHGESNDRPPILQPG